MTAIIRLYARLLTFSRRKKAAEQKEAFAMSCGRDLHRLAKLGLLDSRVEQELLSMDADQLILEREFVSSPSED